MDNNYLIAKNEINKFIDEQEKKLISWQDITVFPFPTKLDPYSTEQKSKINIINIFLKTILSNTRQILLGMNTAKYEKQYVGYSIYLKTLLENTINLGYLKLKYETAEYKEIENYIYGKKRTLLDGESVRKKSLSCFPHEKDESGKETTLIYEYYQTTCLFAHPDIRQFHANMRNKSTENIKKEDINNLLKELNTNETSLTENDFNILQFGHEYSVRIIGEVLDDIGKQFASEATSNLLKITSENGIISFEKK